MATDLPKPADDESFAKRLLERFIEMARQQSTSTKTEAQYGEHSNQTDNREAGTVNDNRFTVNLSGLTLVLVVVLGFIIGACGVVMGMNIAKMDEMTRASVTQSKESKQIQVQLMYTNALMIREGMVKPGDMVFGPEGNLEYDGTKFKLPKEK